MGRNDQGCSLSRCLPALPRWVPCLEAGRVLLTEACELLVGRHQRPELWQPAGLQGASQRRHLGHQLLALHRAARQATNRSPGAARAHTAAYGLTPRSSVAHQQALWHEQDAGAVVWARQLHQGFQEDLGQDGQLRRRGRELVVAQQRQVRVQVIQVAGGLRSACRRRAAKEIEILAAVLRCSAHACTRAPAASSAIAQSHALAARRRPRAGGSCRAPRTFPLPEAA